MGAVAASYPAHCSSRRRLWRLRMAQYFGHLPSFDLLGGSGGGDDWGDWDPDRARRGYTSHVRALRDLDLHRDPIIDLPTSPRRTGDVSGATNLSPAGLAMSARAETEDYLTV